MFADNPGFYPWLWGLMDSPLAPKAPYMGFGDRLHPVRNLDDVHSLFKRKQIGLFSISDVQSTRDIDFGVRFEIGVRPGVLGVSVTVRPQLVTTLDLSNELVSLNNGLLNQISGRVAVPFSSVRMPGQSFPRRRKWDSSWRLTSDAIVDIIVQNGPFKSDQEAAVVRALQPMAVVDEPYLIICWRSSSEEPLEELLAKRHEKIVAAYRDGNKKR